MGKYGKNLTEGKVVTESVSRSSTACRHSSAIFGLKVLLVYLEPAVYFIQGIGSLEGGKEMSRSVIRRIACNVIQHFLAKVSIGMVPLLG